MRGHLIPRLIYLFLAISCCNVIIAKILMWDLGGVLFKQNRFGIASSIGLGRFASYALFDWKNPNIHTLLFKALNALGEQQVLETQMVCDEKGNPLPQIMCDWLTGKIAPPDLINRANTHLELLHEQDFFISHREKELLKESISVIFDPELFVYHTSPIKSAVKLLEECAEYCDDGGNGHTLIVLSNWDPYSFDILHEKHPAIFALFDHIVISGDIGFVKPQHALFHHVLTAYNLKPEECYFIDDQLNNVSAAQQCRINGLWLKDGNYRELRRKMKGLGLL